MHRAALVLAIGLAACAASPRPVRIPDGAFDGTDGKAHVVARELAGAPATVLTFFSATCPCQRAHDERLIALYAAYAPRGVAFVAIDVEARSSLERDRAEVRSRRYPFPILSDRQGRLADALGADYATYTVVVDREGQIAYRGGIDSDKTTLRDDATFYVRDALEAVLASKPPATPAAKALGCPLER